MSPEAQRIAIAEACGWEDVRHESGEDADVDSRTIYPWAGLRGRTKSGARLFIPEYTKDLNAMHEAEDALKDLPEYCTNLAAIVYAPLTTAHVDNRLWQGWWFVHATAAQRAEAFLRTLGK